MNGPKRSATSGRSSARGCHGPAPPDGAPRGGFTLVELLIVITIIGILAGLAMGALTSARETARIAKTKATIAKLDLLVQQHYDSYRTRRVTIYWIDTSSGTPKWIRVNPSSLPNPKLAALLRLHAIRDLMRMEMPERWKDFVQNPRIPPPPPPTPVQADPIPLATSAGTFYIKPPSLAKRYLRKFAAVRPSGDYASGECLYMWLTSAIPDAREQFAENEVGDADDDGWPEFIDGWGNPIKFLRWAPAFMDSDVQQNVPFTASRTDRRNASEADHDPFDPRKLDIDPDPSDVSLPPRGGWRLVPLIFSAGPDGIYGIRSGREWIGTIDPSTGRDLRSHYTGNPYYFEWGSGTVAPEPSEVGAPVDEGQPNVSVIGPKETASSEDYLDNIHNHRAEGN